VSNTPENEELRCPVNKQMFFCAILLEKLRL